MNRSLVFLTMFGSLCLASESRSQDTPNQFPEVGKPCPEFILKDVGSYTARHLSLQELRGQYVILDFWNKYCSACVESFPKVNKLHKEFFTRINLIVIGKEEEGIRSMFTKFKERFDLRFPNAFDSVLYNRFVPGGAPHIIWIDRNGIVRAITASTELTSENILAFINDTKFPFIDRGHKATEDEDAIALKSSLGWEDKFLISKIVLREKPPSTPYRVPDPIYKAMKSGKVEGCASLISWYWLAYTGYDKPRFSTPLYGKFWPYTVLRLEDSTKFLPDWTTEGNLYCLSASVPLSRATPDNLMKVLQSYLKMSFGYEVSIEIQERPYWKLIATNTAKESLRTTGNAPFITGNSTGVQIQNCPVRQLLQSIWGYNQREIPIIDETEINGNIDISLDAIMTEFEDVKAALEEIGMSFKKSRKPMKVLVVAGHDDK